MTWPNSNFFFGQCGLAKCGHDLKTILDESGQRRYKELFGRLFWLDRFDIENAVC